MFRGASFYTCEWAQASNCSLSILVAFLPSHTISELTYALIVPIPTYIECTLCCIIILNIQLSPSKDKNICPCCRKNGYDCRLGHALCRHLVNLTILHQFLVCLFVVPCIILCRCLSLFRNAITFCTALCTQ